MVSAAIGASHSSAPTSTTRSSPDQRKRTCAAGGVSSSISAGPKEAVAAPCPPPVRKYRGANRPPTTPTSAAPATISGNGSPRAKIATKAAAAIAHNTRFFSARVPMRCAACSTIAVTAGLMP